MRINRNAVNPEGVCWLMTTTTMHAPVPFIEPLEQRNFGTKSPAADRLEALGIDRICGIIRGGGGVADVAKHARCSTGQTLEILSKRPGWSARIREARFDTAWLWDEEAEKRLNEAGDLFDLAKAKELANHYRWRAARLNQALYGDQSKQTIEATVVTMSPEERRERIAALQAKLFGVSTTGPQPQLTIEGKAEKSIT